MKCAEGPFNNHITCPPTPTGPLTFLYDGLDIVQESGGTGAASYLRTLAIDETLARTDTVSTLFSLADALGSTVALTDATGATPTTYTYAPFGDTTVTGTPSASPFRFTGRENDGTGLYYYRARYYDPGWGRFVSEDLVSESLRREARGSGSGPGGSGQRE